MSVLCSVKERKRKKCLGEVDVIGVEQYGGLELDAKIELVRSLIPLGLMHVHELLDEEVKALAGERYNRKEDESKIYRHGANPGSVRMAGQRVPIKVPRLRDGGQEVSLASYAALSGPGELDEQLLRRVLHGISCRNYEEAAEAIPGAIGLSPSSVSRGFVKASSAKLREFQERGLHDEDIVALFLDGKTFAKSTMVVAMGVTMDGKKRFLGFVETDTENKAVTASFLRSLMERGLDISQGLLVVIDGSKGLKSAVRDSFLGQALVQRCQWHKRENIVGYLPKNQQALWRSRLQSAYSRPTYQEAHGALMRLHRELDSMNQSAAASLAEGLEETLSLHRLGVFGILGSSFKTTNCLENVNGQIQERVSKVDCWKNSNQRHRWLATALLDIEPRLYRVKGYRHLEKLREALKKELKIEDRAKAEKVA